MAQTEVVLPPPPSDLDDTFCHLSEDGETALCGADLTGDNQCFDHSNHAECVVCYGLVTVWVPLCE